jgi:tetratricopeptide (TPR) repeat protein
MAEDVHPTTSYRSFYDGLEWLFDGWRFDSTVPGANAHRMRAKYALLTQKFGFQAKPAETWCYIIGHEALSAGQTSDAIEYFKYYVESYPESSYAHSSLAEAYAEAGQIERAIESCEKSLGLDPENSTAQRLLESIRGTR